MRSDIWISPINEDNNNNNHQKPKSCLC